MYTNAAGSIDKSLLFCNVKSDIPITTHRVIAIACSTKPALKCVTNTPTLIEFVIV